ncbi:MAG: hypothetical protein Q9219_007603 [cf. Caloplaca sp. 3 TL-2023]
MPNASGSGITRIEAWVRETRRFTQEPCSKRARSASPTPVNKRKKPASLNNPFRSSRSTGSLIASQINRSVITPQEHIMTLSPSGRSSKILKPGFRESTTPSYPAITDIHPQTPRTPQNLQKSQLEWDAASKTATASRKSDNKVLNNNRSERDALAKELMFFNDKSSFRKYPEFQEIASGVLVQRGSEMSVRSINLIQDYQDENATTNEDTYFKGALDLIMKPSRHVPIISLDNTVQSLMRLAGFLECPYLRPELDSYVYTCAWMPGFVKIFINWSYKLDDDDDDKKAFRDTMHSILDWGLSHDRIEKIETMMQAVAENEQRVSTDER